MEPIIALTYRRVSTYRQERDGVSLDVQTDQCIDYIRRQPGWRLGGDFQDTLTGRTAKRRDYQRMLAEARQLRERGHQVVIVTAALDRMGRDLGESVRSRKELRGLGVPLHCIREGGVLQELQADVYASIAADESRRIAARVAGNRKRFRDRGWRGPSRAPWGYVWDKATDRERLADSAEQVLRPDPATIEYVREAWARVAAGETVRQVALWSERLNSEARGGRKLDFANILRMFKNVTYIGRVDDPERGAYIVHSTDQSTGEQVAKKKRRIPTPDLEALSLPSGRWEAIVDDVTWRAVQNRIGGHRQIPRQSRGEYLLSGLVRCPKCGGRMQGRHPSGGKVKGSRDYTCGMPSRGCYFGSRADQIDRAVLNALGHLLEPLSGDAELLRAMRAEWARMLKPVDRPGAGRVKTLERIIAKARKRQDDYLALLADKVITREKYDRGVATEQADIDSASAELAELREQTAPLTLPPFDQVMREVGSWGLVLQSGTMAEQRELLPVLIDTVIPIRVGYGKYTAQISLTPLGQAVRAVAGDSAGAVTPKTKSDYSAPAANRRGTVHPDTLR
jgi:site-specific DNA recombinase